MSCADDVVGLKCSASEVSYGMFGFVSDTASPNVGVVSHVVGAVKDTGDGAACVCYVAALGVVCECSECHAVVIVVSVGGMVRVCNGLLLFLSSCIGLLRLFCAVLKGMMWFMWRWLCIRK